MTRAGSTAAPARTLRIRMVAVLLLLQGVLVPAPVAADCQGGVVWPSLDRARGTTFVGVFDGATADADGFHTFHWTVEDVYTGPLNPGPLDGWGSGDGCHPTGYREGTRYLVSSQFPGGADAFDTVAFELLGDGRVRLAPFPHQPRSTAPRVYRGVDTLRQALSLLVPERTGNETRPKPDPGASFEPITQDRAKDELFVLSITTDRPEVTAGDPIAITTTLRYVGNVKNKRANVSGPGGGLVAFGIEQQDGPFDTGPSWRLSCGFHEFEPDGVRDIPFAKSGGFDADDSRADRWRSWFADPVLRLPEGRYVITAYAHHGGRGSYCRGPWTTLEASVAIEVVAAPAQAPSASAMPTSSAGGPTGTRAGPSVPATTEPSLGTWTSEGIKATSDLQAIAEANGWTIDQAKAQQAANRAIDDISGTVFEEQPDIYIGGALAEEPGGAPSLYLKGPAPQWVLDLVAEAGGPIIVVDEQPYSFDELEARKDRVHQALVDAGYPNVATGVDITSGGVIPVSLLSVAGLPSDPEAILAFVPEELRADVQLDVTIAPPRPSAGPDTWGPLAVVYQPAGFGPGVGLGPVTLRIGETCVWIESKQGRYPTTLVFEGDHVDWRPAKRRIVFTDRRGETVRLSDGDRIEGGGVSLWPPGGHDGGVTPTSEPGRRWGASLDEAWLAEPDASCPERLFFLSEATVRKGSR